MYRTNWISRVRKWILRLACTIGLLSIAVVGCVSVATVQPASTNRLDSSAESLTAVTWPLRSSPEFPKIEVEQGSGPADLGAFKNCRVLLHMHTQELTSYLLVTKFVNPAIQVRGKYNFSIGEGEQASQCHMQLDNGTYALVLVQPSKRQPAIGTMYYLASIEGLSAREQKLLKVACDAGWNVITTTVEMSFSYPLQVPFDDEGERALAWRINNHLADRAYAVESITQFLEEKRPELITRPRVMVGMSAGAIALPTVASRIGNVDAAVLIGGGENAAEIMLTSPLFKEHTTLVESTGDVVEPVQDRKRRIEFAQRVFGRCQLDPANMAASLKTTPVLMVHAQYDKIVPARAGQALFESLGKPERWTYRTGHIGLCVLMQQKIGPILDWLEREAIKPIDSSG